MVDVILGLQWGDEGKGKIADFLTPGYDLVARFQGGPNAGHSLEFGGKKFVLNTIPSGIFREGCLNLIGNGVVIDPIRLRDEIGRISDECPDWQNRLLVSRKAHLILPTHRILDAASEHSKGADKIGSTLRGIGPAYRDKTGRTGIRVGDAMSADFEKQYRALVEDHLKVVNFLGYDQFNLKEEEEKFFSAIEFLRGMKMVDSEYLVNEMIRDGKKILAEGAQGSMLDVEFGTYPFVTSSNTLAGGVSPGLGVAPRHIGKVIGIFKAYCTRVGGGPFPTELNDETGEFLRQKGNEFGATTGRARRTGWLDMVSLNYACMLSGVTDLIMMKSDVLCGMPEVKVATSYQYNGGFHQTVPYSLCTTEVIPQYTDFGGWGDEVASARTWQELPESFRRYVSFCERSAGAPIGILSVGPGRDQTIQR